MMRLLSSLSRFFLAVACFLLLSCSCLGQQNNARSVRIVNDSPHAVQLHWLAHPEDTKTELISDEGGIAPGGDFSVNSFVGHHFEIRKVVIGEDDQAAEAATRTCSGGADDETCRTALSAGRFSVSSNFRKQIVRVNDDFQLVEEIIDELRASKPLTTPCADGVEEAGTNCYVPVPGIDLSSAASVLERGRPFLVYGTAWKKDRTADCVYRAVSAGFRFIDTAGQPKHYNEAGVGEGWSAAAQDYNLDRSDFFLQTKFTPLNGQDPDRLPYNREDPIETQVRDSFARTLKNMRTEYVDSYVLHGPYDTMEDTMRAWRAMEALVDHGAVKRLGMSNMYSLEDFTTVYTLARIKPAVLQNRFVHDVNPSDRFDTQLRRFCKEHDIWYQSFWTLTGNRDALNKQQVHQWATEVGLTPQTLMFAFLLSLPGSAPYYFTPLSGTVSDEHMEEDVDIMHRIQHGQVYFPTRQDLDKFARLLGLPGL